MTPVQETPQIFTLVLVLCVLASIIVLLMVAYRLIRGRRARALALFSRWAAAVVVYITISVAVSVARPVRLIEQGQNWCFDDWCVAVEGVHRRPLANGQEVIVTTDVRVYNAARSPEGARTSIDFVVPNGARQLGFVTGHGSSTPCGFLPSLLEIGQGGCLFHQPNMIRVE